MMKTSPKSEGFVGVRFKRNEIPASRRKTTYSTGTSAGPIKSNFLDFIVFVIR